ncbi:MAG: MATE family efflux transporter [Oscillospiraceae bacterium]|nr:MATE family efflux transporter [Oscillospiraceae bacterium]
MAIALSDHFTYRRLLRFVLPSIGMMIFTSFYNMVDGFFVANYTGDVEFAAINLIIPFLMICATVGFMVGTGGTALVSMRLGEKRPQEANAAFSLLTYFVIFVGILLTTLGEIFLPQVSLALGATAEMLPYCVQYGRYVLASLTPFMLLNMFQSFLVAAEKPRMGLLLTVSAGVSNIVLDALLVAHFRLGVAGAAIATCLSETVGGLIPLIYFALPNRSLLRLGSARIHGKTIWKACSNGFSEFMSNFSMSGINMLYNLRLLKIVGQMGVSAYGIVLFTEFLFVSTFVGFSIGVAPIIGFNYGAQNEREQKNVFRKNLTIIFVSSVFMWLLGQLLSRPIALMYVSHNEALLQMTQHAFALYALSFIFKGINIFASAHFTALNNGLVSAAISTLRMLVFRVAAVMILPEFLGLDGVWLSVVAAEAATFLVSAALLIRLRKRYHYA